MNSFGRLFRISVFGESHGDSIGVVLDGVPAGLPLASEDFLTDIERRKPNKPGTTERKENDLPQLISGVYNGYTTGTPLCVQFRNENVQSGDYKNIGHFFRPGHADFVADKKYKGFNDPRGGGHFSGRLTLAIVAAGVVAKKIISPIYVTAQLIEVGGSRNLEETIDNAMKQGDSVGGIVECIAQNMPIGLGEPFFDSLESMLAHAVFSIPAIKGIEFGDGFRLAKMKGSEANDTYIDNAGNTFTNHSGGINGGISNGNQLVFRVVVKPTSSIMKSQLSYHIQKQAVEEIQIQGRHDACIALRVPVVLEAVTACVLADAMLVSRAFD